MTREFKINEIGNIRSTKLVDKAVSVAVSQVLKQKVIGLAQSDFGFDGMLWIIYQFNECSILYLTSDCG